MKKLREILAKLVEEESNLESIEVSGNTLEEALEKARLEYDTDMTELDYEIVEFGSKGFMGMGKKEFVIKAYRSREQNDVFKNIMEAELLPEDEFGLESEVRDKDSEVFLRVVEAGALLKVTPPVGGGRKVTEQEVLNIIETRGVTEYELNDVKKIIKGCAGEYVKIGSMPLNVINDSTANVQISSDKMKAYLILTPPKKGGYDLEIDEIENILKSNDVIVGIKEDELNGLIDYPVYNEPILIAQGSKAKNGQDAHVTFHFRTDNKIELQEEEGGNIDFRNLNIVQNVVAGQTLAEKMPATDGEMGRTVTNEMLLPKKGKDLPLQPGKNTYVSEDGLKVIAEKNGQVNIAAGKVNVEEVLTISGDVNLKTGNITFLGTVIVQGNVEDTFSITAQGNIEIKGSVGKCNLDAEGDIMVTQGIMGKNEGTLRAGKSIYAKFVENVKYIEAGEGVYIQDGIMHSYIDATKEITCVGKRATIVGGRLRSGELVSSKTLGSTAGTETIIEVGVDPKKRQELEKYNEDKERAYKELEPLEADFYNLENQKKQLRKNFPKEKQEKYDELKEHISRCKETIAITEEKVEEIHQYLSELKKSGKVVASKVAYPHVRIYIKHAFLQIKTEYKKVAFVLESGEVDVQQYTEEPGFERGR